MANFLHFIPALPRSSRGASSWGGGEGGDVFVRWGWGCFCEVGLGTFLRDLGGGQCGGEWGGGSLLVPGLVLVIMLFASHLCLLHVQALLFVLTEFSPLLATPPVESTLPSLLQLPNQSQYQTASTQGHVKQ